MYNIDSLFKFDNFSPNGSQCIEMSKVDHKLTLRGKTKKREHNQIVP